MAKLTRFGATDAYRLGGRMDDRARAWLTASRWRWVLIGVLAYSLFEAIAPFVVLAQRPSVRILEGFGFAGVVIIIAWMATRAPSGDP